MLNKISSQTICHKYFPAIAIATIGIALAIIGLAESNKSCLMIGSATLPLSIAAYFKAKNPHVKMAPIVAMMAMGSLLIGLAQTGNFGSKDIFEPGSCAFMGAHMIALGCISAYAQSRSQDWKEQVKIISALSCAIAFAECATMFHLDFGSTTALWSASALFLSAAYYQRTQNKFATFLLFATLVMTSATLPLYFNHALGNATASGIALLATTTVPLTLALGLLAITRKNDHNTSFLILGAALFLGDLSYLGHAYMNFDLANTLFFASLGGATLLLGALRHYASSRDLNNHK